MLGKRCIPGKLALLVGYAVVRMCNRDWRKCQTSEDASGLCQNKPINERMAGWSLGKS